MAAVRFNPRAWKHRAIVVLLAQEHPRDLLTGERIEVERHFGAAIHGHHLFPRAWARDNPNKAAYEQVDSISNVAAITGYTDTWIRDAAPEHYLGRIRDLGVPADRLRELLSDHLVNYDLLHSDRFAEFRDDRLQRLQHLVATTLKPTHAGDAAPDDGAG